MPGMLQPFVGYIPASSFAPRVVGPPRALLSDEHRDSARRDPLSFRYVGGRKAGSSREEAAAWLRDCRTRGVLRPIGPAVIVYRQDRAATGLLADLSLSAYVSGQVKRHEKTIARTQRKMAEYMRMTRVYGNPPVTAVRSNQDFEAALSELSERPPDEAFETVDGALHELWVVDGVAAETLCRLIIAPIYITDGHHRLAAASIVALEEGRDDARLPVGVFPAGELRLASFARCIVDPDIDADRVVAMLESGLEIDEVAADRARPEARYEFGARILDRYFRLRIPPALIPDDPHASLNTNLLQELVLRPVLGIENSRTDSRLAFAAAVGDAEPCAQADAWFLPYPLTASDVMTVADSGQTMPPKSTWFAPKLPSGLMIRHIDDS